MALNNAAKNLMLDALEGVALYASLHTSAPNNDTGTNEATGGSPAYARKAVTWAATAGGASTTSGALVFDVPAGTYSHIGLWSAASGGTFYGGQALSAPETFAGQGTYTVPVGDLDIVLP